jgi:formate-dependent phosphoribosylglycinamide formyltransferase (GAR transformylase)
MSTAVVAAIAVAALQKRLTTVVTVLPSAGAMVATPDRTAPRKVASQGKEPMYALRVCSAGVALGTKDLGSKV